MPGFGNRKIFLNISLVIFFSQVISIEESRYDCLDVGLSDCSSPFSSNFWQVFSSNLLFPFLIFSLIF